MSITKKIPTVSFLNILYHAGSILKNPLPFHQKNFARHGDSFLAKVAPGNEVIFTRDAGFAKHMLQKNHRNYIKSKLQTRDLARYIGNGLLTINGDTWLKQRRMIQPAFHKKELITLLEGMENTISKQLKDLPQNITLHVLPRMGNLAFNVVAQALFTYEDKKGYIPKLQHITEQAQRNLVKELRQPYKMWWFRLNGSISEMQDKLEGARKMLLEIINERRESDKKQHDLLDMLLEARYDDGTCMSDKQLIDEILVLFVAGHETTANTLTFALWLLAIHTDKQEKVLTEIDALDASADPLEKIKNLPYTMQVLEEALRLYPPGYFSDRVNLDEDEFEGMHLKPKTQILISFYEIHRDPKFWDAAEAFQPERFETDKKKAYSDHYFPFGAGPRMCIGNNFAMYEMVLVLEQIFKTYTVSTEKKEIAINPLITLKPHKAFLIFTPRA
ncbi:cytochrome P450 [Gangjinia marincola]|uniref:Cytochrome P450 n=1 Tax=Gangjinia marincola TaxID=578463 RepID=A0ABP3XV20_9FLAO